MRGGRGWRRAALSPGTVDLVPGVHRACRVVVQLLSQVQLLRPHGLQGLPVFTISWSLLKFMSIGSVVLSNQFILCRPLLLLPSIFPSVRVFSNKSSLHIRWPEDWSFSFSINPSNEYSGLISLRFTGLISLQSKGLSRVFSSTTIQRIKFSAFSLLYVPNLTSINDYWKDDSFDYTQSDVSAF